MPSFPAKPRGCALLFHWRRIVTTLAITIPLGLLVNISWDDGFLRTVTLGFVTALVFGVFEQWPRRLPRWMARWVLQVAAVAIAMPIGTYLFYRYSTPVGAPPFWENENRLSGFASLTMLAMLVAPWAALAALVRQKEAFARHQALSFALERSELERQALDARLHLLQAQVAPHFLFNTLANVQALVDAGSPQAPSLLRSLIAYLRAAVPRLDRPATTLREEVALAKAYLELMHMRMPDRLAFHLRADEQMLDAACPALTVLTLVENAVRHGIDPSESGGRIDVVIARRDDQCLVRVTDTGMGLGPSKPGSGTGLATLRERLALIFGAEAQLHISENSPSGVCAELVFPAPGARA
ncbi:MULTISPECIES: sensor histidine kinase [Dyella]|uniref:Sensor histidine kinase n=2 Tax=Dyella TaxID=231454 RepID=A0A4V6NA09_9GAMM|nr:MULTISPECIES: histidine kinase [Dyella]TBR40481.1 sensor histidine kinase [Dyella terrae]TCI11937.1 sensor histidine kinase [Dyella soli]